MLSCLPFQVQQLTKDIPVIVDALRYSTVVEVQGDKVRRHNEWKKWLLPSARHSESGSHTPGAAPENALATSLQNVSLDDGTINSTGNTSATEGHTEKATGNVSSEELTGHSGLPNGENSAEEAHSI
ncbi:hypothetical protein CDL12_14913 [Handroanthus impetiginosus]|uniref:Uncharacterized protein n=1 Tax=Handroanthus impetiginosus TaxID=429701 RepID=A0A2G9H4N6_9LAMI|nr:hypothetical protein CDL12_14913 [Handroanthus impetiginosus]